MIPNDIMKGYVHHPSLDRAIALAEEHYPALEINITKDEGDIVKLYLQDLESFGNDVIASYNKWYDEVTFYKLVCIKGPNVKREKEWKD